MMKFGICYCEMGIMSQCVAMNYSDQYVCDFFIKSDGADKCIHHNESMNNHCWSPDAQAFSRIHGVVRAEDLEEGEEYNIEERFIDVSGPRRNCHSCIHHPCHEFIKMSNAAFDTGGISANDLWDIGTNCPEYEDDEMINAAINKTLTP